MERQSVDNTSEMTSQMPSECRSMAKAIGTAQKRKIEELGGSMASYMYFVMLLTTKAWILTKALKYLIISYDSLSYQSIHGRFASRPSS